MDMFDMSYPLPEDPNAAGAASKTATLPGTACSIGQVPSSQPESSTTTSASDCAALVEGLSPIKMPTLVLGVQSDILFPYWQQKEIADCLKQAGNKNVTYYELDAMYGHDTFLIDIVNIGGAIKGHLENVIRV